MGYGLVITSVLLCYFAESNHFVFIPYSISPITFLLVRMPGKILTKQIGMFIYNVRHDKYYEALIR